MHVLVAPDKFKGTLDARAACRAIAAGVRRALPDVIVTERPLADGGEGTVDALLAARPGDLRKVVVTGPLGQPVEAAFALLHDDDAVIEVAAACGLALVRGPARALEAGSRGVGELIRAAFDRGARRIVVGVGGTASSDGGTGAAAALGWRFLDASGRPLAPGGGSLVLLDRIDGDDVEERLQDVEIAAGCDVMSELLGANGAARLFGPQKGATSAEVARLEEGLGVLAERIHHDVGVDVAGTPAAGAGGGLGAGLLAFFGAPLRPGFDLVAAAVGLDSEIDLADVVVTGEGRLDEGSARGKVPIGVARRAAARGVPCLALAGEIALDEARLRRLGFARSASLVDELGADRARGEAGPALERVAELLVRRALRP